MTALKKTGLVTSDDEAFRCLAAVIQKETGVQLGEKQSSLIFSRISKRFRELGLNSCIEYLSYFENNKSTELDPLISLLTTHHTFFLREFVHFEFLLDNLEKIAKRVKKSGRKKIRIWSSACSYGHEVYSLAMFLNFHLPSIAPGMDFEIVGSDVDKDSVKRSEKGIYRWNELRKVPKIYMKGNWLKGTGEISDYVLASKNMKTKCSFKKVNLVNFSPRELGEKFDIIFCRNVFIYFTNDQIHSIIKSFEKMLVNEGHLILGVSELIQEKMEKLNFLGKSIYQYMDKAVITKDVKKSVALENLPVKEKVYKVLCVDDSPVVLKILEKIIDSDPSFEIVGKVKDGLQAKDFIRNNSVDLVTLDIHMPNMNGIEYLENNFKEGHPPVLMVSSVSEEDSKLALEAIRLGATDYVEKPTLDNMSECADEILNKLKTIRSSSVEVSSEDTLSVAQQFSSSKKLNKPGESLKIVMTSTSESTSNLFLMKEINQDSAPVVFCMSNEGAVDLPSYIKEVSPRVKIPVKSFHSGQLDSGTIYICDSAKVDDVISIARNKESVFMVVCDISADIYHKLDSLSKANFIVEDTNIDRSSHYQKLAEKSFNKVQITSFDYESDLLLIKKERSK